MESEYMQWAKIRSHFKYNLAVSGVVHYPLKNLAVSLEDLELSGPSYYGYEPLQKALAEKCHVSVENVVATAGTSMANHLAMAALIREGDEVLIEQPTYEPLLAVARYLGANVKRFVRRYENGFQLDLSEVRQKLTPHTRLIVITNLHNPSSALTDSGTMKELGLMARSAGARVLVDEVYLETLFDSSANHSAFSLGNHFVTTGSLTKAYGLSGLRCGWILADPDLARKIWLLNDLFSSTPAHPAERLSVVALRKLEQIANRARALLDTNRAMLKESWAQQDQLEVILPDSGTVIFPRMKKGNSDNFCKLLGEKYETGVVPGRYFEMPEHFRLGLGCDVTTFSEGLHRLLAALRE